MRVKARRSLSGFRCPPRSGVSLVDDVDELSDPRSEAAIDIGELLAELQQELAERTYKHDA